VIDVTVNDNHTTVCYVTPDGALHSVEAEAVVVACPKFVAARIINDMEAKRLEAIKQLEYRSYVVANILLDGDIAERLYDLYLLGDLGVTGQDPRGESQRRGATDVICANYAAGINGSSVLTLYQALPYKGGRAELLAQEAYETWRGRFEAQIANEIAPLFGLKDQALRDVRLTRWGHPLPVASRGFVADGYAERVQAPFRDRVFFVEQDNWALPGIETAVYEAAYWTPKVKRLVRG
jgi:protoporphyrinogen oxidase